MDVYRQGAHQHGLRRWIQVGGIGVKLLPLAGHAIIIGCGALSWTLMRIVVLVGLPGSGKSTYLSQLAAPGLSSDTLRKLLADDENDQTIHNRVFQTMRYLLRQRIAIGRPVTYIDATNLTPAERRPYIAIGRAHGCEVEAVFFDVPASLCRERNAARHRVVPEDVMAKMETKLVPPAVEEGFDRVTRLGPSS